MYEMSLTDLLFIVGICLAGGAAPFVAAHKGYNWPCWLFSGGIGLLVLLYLPNVIYPYRPLPVQMDLESRGNQIGITLSLLTLALTLARWLFAQQ